MKIKNATLAVLLVFFVSQAYALEDPFLYVSLGYGRGWFSWSCLTEQGETGFYGTPLNFCNTRLCPFETAASIGENNCFEGDLMTGGAMEIKLGGEYSMTEWGAKVRLNIPEDYKLVMQDGSVVGDELCVNDLFSLDEGALKGEYYNEGGHEDTPSVYWVDDVEAIVDKLMEYHDSKTLSCKDIAAEPEISDGYVDPVTGIPVYSETASPSGRTVFARMVCSLREKEAGITGVRRTGGFYEVTDAGTAHFESTYDVECMYYYYGGDGSCMQDLDTGDPLDVYGHDGFVTLRLPMVLQARPLQEGEDTVHVVMNRHDGSVEIFDFPAKSRDEPVYGYFNEVHNILYNSVSDFFKVGEIGISKDIQVVSPASPQVELSVAGEDSIKIGEPNTLRVLVRNKGDVDIRVGDMESNAPYEFIVCDSAVVAPDAETECLLSVTPKEGEGLTLDVSYEYKSCGRPNTGKASKDVIESTIFSPSNAAQVYGIEVYGDCENSYYACDATAKDGFYAAGYRCIEENGYYTPASGRFNVLFDLSGIQDCSAVSSARLVLNALKVNKAQDVEVYGINDDWSQVSCSPGGDICTQPYCSECKPLYDASPDLVSSVKVSALGDYFVDVTDAVKNACGGDKKLSLQVRGDEGVWDISGVSSCGVDGEWKEYGVSFQSTGTKMPRLQILSQ